MPKKTKKIETMKVEIYGENINFLDLIKTATKKEYSEGIEKIYTLYKIEETDKYYRGYVSTTKLTDIAPKHIPKTNIYEKLPINSGEGLGYSNVFIYDKTYNIIMYEFNINGCYLSAFSRYLSKKNNEENENKASLEFFPVLRKEAYERMLNMEIYKSIEFQMATPERRIKKYLEEHDALENIIDEANELKSERISIKYDIVGKPIKGMPSRKISSLIKRLNFLKTNNPEDIVEKLIVSGYYFDPEEEKTKSDQIDLMLDRYKKSFTIEQPFVLTDPKTREKSSELLNVYLKCKKDFKELFKETV